jgi:hypothetical protein
MHVGATLGSTGMQLREEYFFEISKEKSQKVFLFHICVGALIRLIAMEVLTFLR